MTQDQLTALEQLNERWANETPPPPADLPHEVMDLLPDVIQALREREGLMANLDYSVNLAVATATEKLTAERDAALEACRVAGIGAYKGDYFLGRLTETGQLRQELSTALKACAQKDDALQDCSQFPLGEDLHYKVCAALDGNTCGKGYHADSEWGPVVEALRKIIGAWSEADMPWEARIAEQALAHAAKLMEGK